MTRVVLEGGSSELERKAGDKLAMLIRCSSGHALALCVCAFCISLRRFAEGR